MKKIIEFLFLTVFLLFSAFLFAANFDDEKPVKSDRGRKEKVVKNEEDEPEEQVKKAEEPVKEAEAKPVEKTDSSKKNLHPGFSEDEAFEELLRDVMAGKLEHVDSLLSTFPKLLNKRDEFGRTPLFFAVSANQYPITELLVKMNADIKLANIYGDTPFHKAAQLGEIKILELLLKHRASIWGKNIKGESPLAKAVSAGQIETVKFLIKNMSGVNTPDIRGDTPLHKAAIKGDKNMVKLLLDNGADAGVKNKENLKPADLAKNTEIRKMIESKDPSFGR
jgi:ankyrin repeat protein